MKWGAVARCLSAAAVGALVATIASATVVTMNAVRGGQIVASGYFSFDDSKSGIIGFNDLTAFRIQLPGGSFSLADVQSFAGYSYFAYDTASRQLIDTGNPCGSRGCAPIPVTIVSLTDDLKGFDVLAGDGNQSRSIDYDDNENSVVTPIDGFSVATFDGVTLNPSDVVVTMAGLRGADSVASGFFSYNRNSTGVLGFDDLTGFEMSLFGNTYGLAHVQSADGFSFFSYDTSTGQMLTSTQPCGTLGCVPVPVQIVSLTDQRVGFDVTLPDRYNGERAEIVMGDDARSGPIDTFSTFRIDPGPAAPMPEVSSWVMLVTGFGIVGAALRRRTPPVFA